MPKQIAIAWEGGEVSGRYSAAGGSTGVLLAHGAGLGQDHEWMVFMRDGLAAAGIPVMTFDYPYMEEGRKAPNPARMLLACHRAALAELRHRVDRVVLAGKSMGGRMGSHVAADGEAVAGLVFYGYPLVGVGKTEPRDVSHLADVGAPMLFVQGTRDRMAPLDLIKPVAEAFDASIHVVEDGDHSLRVLKRTGRDIWDVLDEVVGVTAEWIGKL
jgi:predicted alpha/beta-hydrolase family hydrolase